MTTLPPLPVVRTLGPRLRVALCMGALARWVARCLGRGGGVISGRVLLWLCPGAPEILADGRHVSLVTGTNGKSTATAMLAAALSSTGEVVTNADGANTSAGLLANLGRGRAPTVVLETDEGWLPWAVRRLRPETVVLLNLSRDQLHRNPEVGLIAHAWREALRDIPLVVANCDDPAVTWAAGLARRVVWVACGRPWTEDSVVCPACGDLLRWEGPHWSSVCGLQRPRPARDTFDDDSRTDAHTWELHLPGEVNRANARLAIAAAVANGADPVRALSAVAGLRGVAGRYQEFDTSRHRVRLLLAKNPASWQVALRLVGAEQRPVVLAFNADGVDGRDPSWLYDVDFSPLRGRPVAVTGRRATDLSVRLRINEVPTAGQFPELDAAIARLPEGPVDLIANYTAFQDALHKYA